MNQTTYQDVHTKFGIDEIYIHKGLDQNLLNKLTQRAEKTLDASDTIIKKHASADMILIFYKKIPTQNLIYRFLEFLDQNPNKDSFLKDNTLLNEEELFAAIKLKNFVLITPKVLTMHANA